MRTDVFMDFVWLTVGVDSQYRQEMRFEKHMSLGEHDDGLDAQSNQKFVDEASDDDLDILDDFEFKSPDIGMFHTIRTVFTQSISMLYITNTVIVDVHDDGRKKKRKHNSTNIESSNPERAGNGVFAQDRLDHYDGMHH
jgi:hypothetical protein